MVKDESNLVDINFKKLIDNSHDAIVVVGLDGKFKYISPQLSNLIGRNITIANDLFFNIHPDDVDDLIKLFFKAVKKKEVLKDHEVEFRTLHANGNYIWFSSSSREYYNDNGELLGFITSLRDITTKKETEQKFRDLTELLPETVFELDLQGNIGYTNPMGLEKFGYDNNDLKSGINGFDLFADEEGRKNAAETLRHVLLGKQVDPHDYRMKKKDGTIFYARIHSKPRIKDGNIVGLRGIISDITARKTAEIKLRESEEKYRHLFNNTPYAIWLINSRGIVIDCNESMNKIWTAFTKNDIINKDIKKILDMFILKGDPNIKNFQPILIDRFKSLLDQGEIIPLELQVTRLDGKKMWLSLESTILDVGEEKLVQVLIRDITERKDSELKIKESEEKFRMLTELLPDVIFEYNLEGLFTYLNRTGLEKFGIYQQDIDNKFSVFKLFSNSDEIKKAKENMKASITGEEIGPQEYLMNTMNGEEIYIRVHTRPKYEKGKIIGVRGVAIDITENKLFEAKLKESETKYRHLFNSNPYAIWLVDLRGKIIDCNETMDEFLSIFKKDDLIGKSFADIIRMFSAKGDPKLKHLEIVFKERFKRLLKDRYLEPIEIEVKRGDGKNYWLTFQSSFVNLTDEPVIQLFIINITNRKLAELKTIESEKKLIELNVELENKVKERTRELKEKNIQLKKLDKAKDEFISMAAHELKTPLISIKGYTDYILFKHKDDLSADIKNDLNIVQKNVNRLQNLMNQLLDVMKLESHKIELKKERTNISEIIYKCLHELNYLFKEKDHQMRLNMDNEIYLMIDPDRIFQVVSNLISNASKFTLKGGIIEISAENKDNYYLFKIKDTGIGIAKENLNRLFEKFETIQNQNGDGTNLGTGLGLYITKGFIEAHGGKIWATSEGLNKGMTIHFTLPL